MTDTDAAKPLEVGEAELEEGKQGVAFPNLRTWQFAIIGVFIGNIVAGIVFATFFLPSGEEESRTSMSLFEPANYTFGIWFPILGLEGTFCVWQLLQQPGVAPEKRLVAIQKLAPGWCATWLFNAAWVATLTGAFDSPELYWVSPALLFGQAVSLGDAHLAVVDFKDGDSAVDYWLLCCPITLHFGWMTAATLVVTNNWVAKCTDDVTLKLVVVAISLAIGAFAAIFFAIRRKHALISGTVAWALIGLALRSFTNPDVSKELGATGAVILGFIELAGAALLIAVSAKVYQKRA